MFDAAVAVFAAVPSTVTNMIDWSSIEVVVMGSVGKRIDTIFISALFFVVQSRTVARQESFQPRAPAGGWE